MLANDRSMATTLATVRSAMGSHCMETDITTMENTQDRMVLRRSARYSLRSMSSADLPVSITRS